MMINDMEAFEQKIKDYLKLKAMRYADSLSSIDKARFEVYDEISMDWFGEHIITTPSWGEDASEEAVERLVKRKQALQNKCVSANNIELREYYKALSEVNLRLMLTPREQCLECKEWGKGDGIADVYPHCMKGEEECLFYLYRDAERCSHQEK